MQWSLTATVFGVDCATTHHDLSNKCYFARTSLCLNNNITFSWSDLKSQYKKKMSSASEKGVTSLLPKSANARGGIRNIRCESKKGALRRLSIVHATFMSTWKLSFITKSHEWVADVVLLSKLEVMLQGAAFLIKVSSEPTSNKLLQGRIKCTIATWPIENLYLLWHGMIEVLS